MPLGSYLALLSLLIFLNVPPKLCSGDKSAHIMGLLRAFIEIMQVKRLAQRLPYCELPIKNTCCPFQWWLSKSGGRRQAWLVHFADLESGEKRFS